MSSFEVPGGKTSEIPFAFGSEISSCGAIPPTGIQCIVHSVFAQQIDDARAKRVVRAR